MTSALSPRGATERHRLRLVTCVLLLVEALALAAAAVYAMTSLADTAPSVQGLGLGIGAFLAIFALALVLAARSLWGFGRFGVSFGITWQLFQALVGASLLRGGLLPAGFFALGMAIALFVLLLRPENRPVREHLIED